MQITDQTIINVFNYSDNPVSLPTHIKPDGYWFEPANNDIPSMLPISFAEIRVANSQSDVFREGRLRFEKEHQEDIYKALSINNWEDILSDKEIKDIILNPTKEKLERIVNIISITAFDKVRGILVSLQNTGQYDISQRVIDTINYRYQELYRGKRRTEIKVYKTKQEVMDEVKDEIIADELEKAKKELEEKIRKELKTEMEKENKKKSTKKTDTNKDDTKKDNKTTKK